MGESFRQIKFLITGVPRSGTTILARYVHSIDNAYCFVEPHQSMAIYRRCDELEKFGLQYKEKLDLPLDSALTQLNYGVIGFKETYKKEHYDLIKKYRDRGYLMIYVVRNPLDTYNSVKRSTTRVLRGFCDNYGAFLDFVGEQKFILYSRFIKNPNLEFASKVDLSIPDKMKRLTTKMGDPDAKDGKIRLMARPKLINNDDRRQIASLLVRYRELTADG